MNLYESIAKIKVLPKANERQKKKFQRFLGEEKILNSECKNLKIRTNLKVSNFLRNKISQEFSFFLILIFQLEPVNHHHP